MDNSTDHSEMTQVRSMSVVAGILGAWLIIAPYVLNYNKTAAYWNEVVTGVIVVIMAIVRYAAPRVNWTSWVNGIAGIWLIVSPFFFAYSKTSSYWNQIIFGILVAIVAFGNASMLAGQNRHMHHPAH